VPKHTQAEWSLLFFALYMLFLGTAFIVVPNLLLELFGFAPTAQPFVRVLGLLLLVLAYYYRRVVSARYTPFYMWTVHTRMFVLPFFVCLVLLDLAPPVVLLFGGFEFACTAWTWLALRAERGRDDVAPAK